MLSVCLSEEESDFLVLEVIPVLPLLFQKRPQHMDLSSVHMDTLQKRQKKKKRKQQSEEGETGTAKAIIHSPQLPEALAPVDLDTRPKKKKTSEEGETGASPTPNIHPELPEAPLPVDLDTPQKKKKKRTKEAGENGIATALIHSPQLPETPAPVDLDTPQKKKRKTREEGETGAALTPDIHPELPEAPLPVDLDTLQKKKKKRTKEAGENVIATALIHSPQLPETPAPVDLDTPQKKKRKTREEGETGAALTPDIHPELPEAPLPVDLDTPQKKRKKKKRTKEAGENGIATALIHSPQLTEAPAPVNLDTSPKKKRKTREEGETGAALTPDIHPELPEAPLPVDLDTPQKKRKKKKRKREAGENGIATALIHSPRLTEAPALVDLDSPGEKKTREEEGGRETSHAPGQTDTRPVIPHTDPDPKLRRKGKRSREETGGEGGSVLVEIGGEEDGAPETAEETATAKEKKSKKEKRRNKERGEGGSVSLGETGGGEEEHARMDGEMDREIDGQTTVAVEASRKRKKKRKSIDTVTTDHNTTHTTEAKTTTTGGEEERRGEKDKKSKRRRGEVLEQSQPAATQAATQDGATVTEGKGKKRRTTQKENGKKERSRGTSRKTTGVEECLSQIDVVDRERQHGEKLRELQEHIPNLLSKPKEEIQKMIRYDLHRFKEFKRQGIELRSGRYSAQENQRIQENVRDFLALTGISSSSHLLQPQRYKQQQAEIKKLRVQHRFLERIADGVARPCFVVYSRARKMLDDLNHRGRFSKDELHSLKKLQTLHGNDWRTISQKMCRSVQSLEKRFNHIASNCGPWKSKEVGRLMKSLQAHFESQVAAGQGGSGNGGPWLYRQQLYLNLPWMEVSHQVQTRTWSQCRVKWFSILKKKMLAGQRPVLSGGPKTVQAKINLINMLYTMKVDDPADINWEEVALAIGRVSPFDVQKAFHRLKVTRVPMWSSCSYCDVIDFLREKEVPRLEEVLKKTRSLGELDKEQQETRGEEQEKYLLSDILSQQEDFSEVDNAQLTTGQSQNRHME